MMTVKCFVFNTLQENTYVVSDETREAVVIDCGSLFDEERAALVSYINDNQLTVVHLLSTHGHFDHNFGNDTIWHEFGLKPEVAAEDEWLMDIRQQVRQMLGIDYHHDFPPVGPPLSENDVIKFGTHELMVIATPGHTRGSVTFYSEAERTAFTGDTLFRMSIGRTDFESGSMPDMMKSLRKLATLPADTKVYAGHGEMTTIGDEILHNPYMTSTSL